MSVASRIEAIETHIGDIYDSLELGGADLTNVNKNIVNINTQLIDRYKDYLANGIDVIWTNWEKVLAEGTDLTLNNTIKARLQLDLKGNTYQYSTTGKNKLPYTLQSIKTTNTSGTWNNNVYTYNGVTFTINDDLSIKIGGTFNSRAFLYLQTAITEIEKNNYILNGCPSGGSDSSYRIVCGVQDGQGSSTSSKDYGSGVNINVSSYTQPMIRAYIDIQSSAGIGKTFYPMLRLSSVVDDTYEPYTNGASPNPDYPQDIHIVSGDNTIKVDGKNLLPYPFYSTTTTTNGITFTDNGDGTIKIRGKATANAYFNIFPNTTGDRPQYKQGTYVFSNNALLPSGITITFSPRNSDGTAISGINAIYINNTTKEGTRAINQDFEVFSNILVSNGTEINTEITIYPMIEKGETASTYTPYQTPQTQLISLGSLWLGKISTYQDYIYKSSGKWYLHKEIGKRVFDGSEEDWEIYNNTIATKTIVRIKNINDINEYAESDYGNAPILISTYFKSTSQASTWNIGTMSRRFQDQNIVYFTIEPPYETLANFKTWLSTHNTELYYPLATPTNTEITNTILKQQLDNIEKLTSYNSQTNISQVNNDEPFIISATALKELS